MTDDLSSEGDISAAPISPVAATPDPPPSSPPEAAPAAESKGTEPAPPTTQTRQSPKVPRGSNWHPSKRVKIGAAIVVVVIVLGIIGNVFLTSRTGPDVAAANYITALESGNADAAWNLMTVQSTTSSGSPSTIGQSAFKVALQAQGNLHPTNVHAWLPGGIGSFSVPVSVSYHDDTGDHTVSLTLVKDSSSHNYLFYPAWKVIVNPVVSTITVSTGVGAVTIDGQSVTATGSPGTMTVDLLPGNNTVSAAGGGLYTETNTTIRVQPDGSTSQQTVAIAPTLNAPALASAKKVVQDLFTHCVQTSSSQLESCPQSVDTPCCGATTVTWSQLGDPVAGMVVQPANAQTSYGGSGATSGSPSFDAIGTFLMIATWPNDSDAGHPSQSLSSGIYDAQLTWNGASFVGTNVGTYNRASAPITVNAPKSVTNAQVLQAVSAGFAACAADPSSGPSNCPMPNTNCSPQAQWTLVGNPTDPSTTQVTFDASSISYKVTGAYTMSFTTPGGSCSSDQFANTSGTDSSNYSAQVVWNGSKLQLIAITSA
jgi:hypothetical protein